MVIELQDYRRKKLQILPRNLHQEDLLDSLNDTQKHIVFATGPAGTGKTMMAVQMGIRKLEGCLLYTSPSPRDATLSRMPSSA